MAPKLFGTAGVRGRYPGKVNPKLAFQLGLAVARFSGSRPVAVGMDTRTTSPLLAASVASGLAAGGSDALLLGVQPLPVTSFSVARLLRAGAGVMVTASHNPPEYNGLKVISGRGSELTAREEDELEELLASGETGLAGWSEAGRVERVEGAHLAYLEELWSRFKASSGVRVLVDCANGAASHVTPRLLSGLGVRVSSLHCAPDGFFPGRHPEPRPDVLEPTLRAGFAAGADLVLAHDGDADRLAVGVKGFGFVKQDLVIALLAWRKLEERRGPIVVSIDVGLEVEEVVEELGGRLVRARLGKIHEKMLEEPGALMAAEPWKLIDPSWGPWVDGVYQAAMIVSMASERPGISERLRALPRYPSARVSYSLPGESERDSLYAALVEEAAAGLSGGATRITLIDGVRIDYGDGSWILLRRSGTEPKIRVYAQAREKGRLKEILATVDSIVKRLAGKMGIRLGYEEHLDIPERPKPFTPP